MMQIHKKQDRKGIVRRLIQDGQGIGIFVQLELEPGFVPVFPQAIIVVPKADKSEYKTTRKLISDWAAEFQDNRAFGWFPEPCALKNAILNEEKFEPRKLLFGTIEKKKTHPLWIVIDREARKMRECLNEQQVRIYYQCS